ncbi:IQ domain-containing protein C isoform X1 [Scleropages formosus]|uniref:IQ motif containing C n=1 Tax=Scleropages formosus TaxID=113540 RepID=A0A8C9SPU1_SCLFO|nr:IQ domain-containing protein C isoform X1 [Scleropages formosus]
MERRELERRVILFQARLRGFQVRKELSSVRQRYEDIVREIEGDVSALVWKGSVIPTPHFTAPLSAWPAGGAPAVRGEQLSQGRSTEEAGDLDGQVYALVPERDCNRGRLAHQAAAAVHRKSSTPELSVTSESCTEGEAMADGMWNSVTETTSVWDNMAMDASCSLLQKKGLQHRTRVEDLPRTREHLRLHRNSLAMELLWLQQAIGSRKKYLVLKQRLATPGR